MYCRIQFANHPIASDVSTSQRDWWTRLWIRTRVRSTTAVPVVCLTWRLSSAVRMHERLVSMFRLWNEDYITARVISLMKLMMINMILLMFCFSMQRLCLRQCRISSRRIHTTCLGSLVVALSCFIQPRSFPLLLWMSCALCLHVYGHVYKWWCFLLAISMIAAFDSCGRCWCVHCCRSRLTGVEPGNQPQHATYLDVEPWTGSTMCAHQRLQVIRRSQILHDNYNDVASLHIRNPRYFLH